MVYDSLTGQRVSGDAASYIEAQKNMKNFTKNNGWIKAGRVLSDIATLGLAEIGWNQYDKKVDDILRSGAIKDYNNGVLTASDLQNTLANSGVSLSPEQETWLNNELSSQATGEARNYDTEMRDTALQSTAEQLQQLGMNPGSAISIGGMSTPNGPQQDVKSSDIAKMRFDRNISMARSLLSLTTGLAGAGVHGASVGSAKKAAATLTSEASRYATDQRYAHIKSTYYDTKNHFKNEYYG